MTTCLQLPVRQARLVRWRGELQSGSRLKRVAAPFVYFVLAECGLVLFEAQAPQPTSEVHDGALATPCSISSAERPGEVLGGVGVRRGREGARGCCRWRKAAAVSPPAPGLKTPILKISAEKAPSGDGRSAEAQIFLHSHTDEASMSSYPQRPATTSRELDRHVKSDVRSPRGVSLAFRLARGAPPFFAWGRFIGRS